ncbi:MAG: hypothetical protein LUC50_06415 [Ruminococcus sp.]|nr:hypothetical protein [Ruminococcus sp.]
MKLKKIAIAAMAVVAMTTSAVNIVVSANNCSDTPFTDYSISSTSKYTSARSKTDATSATVKVTSVSSSGAKMTVRFYNASKVDRTYGTAKVVGVSSTYTYFPNLVYEKGDSSARLGFTRYSGASTFTASGVWSPDSV